MSAMILYTANTTWLIPSFLFILYHTHQTVKQRPNFSYSHESQGTFRGHTANHVHPSTRSIIVKMYSIQHLFKKLSWPTCDWPLRAPLLGAHLDFPFILVCACYPSAAEGLWRRITSAPSTQQAAHTDADGYWQALATAMSAAVHRPAGGGVERRSHRHTQADVQTHLVLPDARLNPLPLFNLLQTSILAELWGQ